MIKWLKLESKLASTLALKLSPKLDTS